MSRLNRESLESNQKGSFDPPPGNSENGVSFNVSRTALKSRCFFMYYPSSRGNSDHSVLHYAKRSRSYATHRVLRGTDAITSCICLANCTIPCFVWSFYRS